jgi:hypothetical protein
LSVLSAKLGHYNKKTKLITKNLTDNLPAF